MVETVVSVGLPVDEKMDIKKNRIKPDTLTGKEKRICFVTGTHGDELEGQYVCYQMNKIINVFTENIYLRKANISLNNISEDLFIRKAKTTINPNSIKDNLTQDNKQQEEQIINNNPFQNYKNDLPQNKTKHKRQRTHVQLNEIQNEEDASKTPTIILTSNSTSTVVDSSKNTDAFGDTLEDLSNFTKTMRRNNDSKKNVFDDIDPPKDGVISPTSSQLLSSNKKQLFYRTPRDKEKKKIEFTN